MRLIDRLHAKRPLDSIDTWAPHISPEEAIERLQHPSGSRTCYEVLAKGAVTKLYLDRDEVMPPGQELTPERIAASLEEVHRHMEYIIHNPGNHHVTYRVAQRHGILPDGRAKLSFRPYVSGVKIKYSDIPRYIHDISPETAGFWDTAPYGGTQQLLGCINCGKSDKDPRIMLPESPEDPVEDYIAQIVDDDWPLLVVPDQDAQVQRQTGQAGQREVNESLAELLRLLHRRRCDDRQQWRDIGTALKNSYGDRAKETFRRWSMQSPKYDEDALERLWTSVAREDYNGARLTLSTVKMMASQDDPEGFEEWDAVNKAAEQHEILVRHLAQRFPQEFGGQLTIQGVDSKKGLVLLERAGNQYVVKAPTKADPWARDIHALSNQPQGSTWLGSLYNDVPVRGPLSDVDPQIPIAASAFLLNHEQEDRAVLRSVAPNVCTITVHNPKKPDSAFLSIQAHGREKTVTARVRVARFYQHVSDAMVKQDAAMNLSLPTLIVNNTTLNVTQNININLDGHGGHGRALLDGDADDAKQARDEETLSQDWLQFLEGLSSVAPDVYGPSRIIPATNEADYHYYNENRGLWSKTAKLHSIANHMVKLMKTVRPDSELPTFWDGLNEADRRFLGSQRGRQNVLLSCVVLGDVRSTQLEQQLDANVDILPFKNGVYDLRTGSFRELRWDDYVTQTIGFDYMPKESCSSDVEFAESFFAQVLPVPEEREMFLALAATSLRGIPRDKKFIVLQDESGGDNGKSKVLDALGYAIGTFAMPSQSEFLLESSMVNANAHQSNMLSYRGKRIALFDETNKKAKFDLAKLKSLTGGAPLLAARGAGERDVQEFRWSAFIIIACNNGCLPRVDATDTAFMNRMVPIPMRAKFVLGAAAPGHAPGTASGTWIFPMDSNLDTKLKAARMGIMHVLLDAWGRHQARGELLPQMPEGCVKLRRKICMDSDPIMEYVATILDGYLDFSEPERTPETRGRRVLAYITQAQVLDLLRQLDTDKVLRGIKVSQLKETLRIAMEARGIPFREHTTIDGARVTNVFCGCSMRQNWEEA